MNRYVSRLCFFRLPSIGFAGSRRVPAMTPTGMSRFEQRVVRMCAQHIFNKFLKFTCTSLHTFLHATATHS